MDATRLRQGLRAYIEALQVQHVEMSEEGERLALSWRVTRDVYRGDGADVFADEFERASQMINQYVETVEQILPLMKKRLDDLDRFDASSNILGEL